MHALAPIVLFASSVAARQGLDPDLPHNNSKGSVLYMRSTDSHVGSEEWAPSLIEKAYARWHGS